MNIPLTPEEAGRQAAAEVKEELREELSRQGITAEYLSKKLKEELEAEETEFAKHQGQILETRQVIAWDVRQRARIDAHKLRGDYPDENVNLHLDKPILIISDAEDAVDK